MGQTVLARAIGDVIRICILFLFFTYERALPRMLSYPHGGWIGVHKTIVDWGGQLGNLLEKVEEG